jgi:hypothetical protein
MNLCQVIVSTHKNPQDRNQEKLIRNSNGRVLKSSVKYNLMKSFWLC